MPKKKKTQLKPVARGFAVTSIPKKAPPEPPPPSRHDSDANRESESSEVPHSAQTHEPVEDKAIILQNAEERSLQDLVDKLQERVEKEIVRTVKVRGDVAGGLDLLIRRPSSGH
jgi:ATP-dependent RNA helicase DHX29